MNVLQKIRPSPDYAADFDKRRRPYRASYEARYFEEQDFKKGQYPMIRRLMGTFFRKACFYPLERAVEVHSGKANFGPLRCQVIGNSCEVLGQDTYYIQGLII